MRFFLMAALCFSAFGCSSGDDATTESAAQVKDVQDIQSMSVRPDGLYDVRCRDGRLEVRSASEIRSGQVCTTGGGGGGGNGALICAARDNDGRDPWVLAVIRSDGSLSRLPGSLYSTSADCRRAVGASRISGRSAIACISRDNDGRDPWIGAQVALDSGTITPIRDLSYSTLDNCIAGIGRATGFQDQLVTCTARDNDGRDPWILGRVTSSGSFVRAPEVQYATIDQCQTALGGSRSTGDALLVCGSRDRDGRDPWNLFSMTASSTTMLSLTYSTLPQCVNGG